MQMSWSREANPLFTEEMHKKMRDMVGLTDDDMKGASLFLLWT